MVDQGMVCAVRQRLRRACRRQNRFASQQGGKTERETEGLPTRLVNFDDSNLTTGGRTVD